ncbi:MAG: 6-phosphofructokinase, partial [Candidatus Zixiibacteriota bacterium]
LMPEFPYDIEAVCEQVKLRNSLGKTFSIVVVGEGAKPAGGEMVVRRRIENSPDAIRLGGISYQVAAQIEGLINIETRVTILGHLLRGGSPTAYDRVLATRLGVEAVKMAVRGENGRMVSVRGSQLTSVPLSEVSGKTRLITPDHSWIKAAESLGLCLGMPTGLSLEESVKAGHI